ncbi:uncharacterized protein LOC116769179 [Danaus plexippus]|uniref:Uncharacterized protein n=1 Tax=Danaus plexippus plexippus TaxID=278856 RepID=A0A212F8C8_DANPL|nr:uncharacterized protein LOC116769179 [Danaus plexippus]OWR49981.1 hypothetical protein KGM_211007 [Danaus plexippus plexippus]
MFDFLPTVENCCFCVRLKIGAILIALCGIIGIGSFGYMTLAKLCGDESGLMPDLVKYFSFAAVASNTLLTITSIIFLIAACMDRFEITATLFLLAILIFLIVNLASIIVIVVAIITSSGCRQNTLYLSALILFPIWFYFMVVVKSYKEEMS